MAWRAGPGAGSSWGSSPAAVPRSLPRRRVQARGCSHRARACWRGRQLVHGPFEAKTRPLASLWIAGKDALLLSSAQGVTTILADRRDSDVTAAPYAGST